MKPKIKLGFTDTHEHIATFFYNILARRFDIELDHDNPDFLIFGDDNFGQSNKKFSRKDVVKIFYTGENKRPEKYDCDYAISFDHNLHGWHYRLPLFVIYMWALEHIHKTNYKYEYIFNPTDVKEKTGFASFVVSNPNCKTRNDFYNALSEYKKIDSGGKHFNNIEANLEGEKAKIDFLSTRKFNICFESYSHPGYVTEKILHAFYAQTVPIYWGSPTIAADFNGHAFVNMHRFANFNKAIEHIQRLDENEDLYKSHISQPKFVHNIPPYYVNLDNFLNWFDAIVYRRIKKREDTVIYF
jgi:hypothetical protein